MDQIKYVKDSLQKVWRDMEVDHIPSNFLKDVFHKFCL